MKDKQFIEAVLGLYQSLSEVIEAYKQSTEAEEEAVYLFPPIELDKIFHDALNMNKVKQKLRDILYMKGKNGELVFKHQKLWYVVYKVFKEMDWLVNTQASKFRLWAASVYGIKGKCTKADFDAVNTYYRENPSSHWTVITKVDKPYIEVAKAMYEEFQGYEQMREKEFLKTNRFLAHNFNK